jgi:SAM-dependent methyltransferase
MRGAATETEGTRRGPVGRVARPSSAVRFFGAMAADATRLAWTGERYVPGHGGVQIELEHQHRYRFAARIVRGRSVLDAASGEGFGARILAETAARVTGVELDEGAVAHARGRYPGIDFQTGDVTALPFPDGSFEAVVSFETIEHVDGPERAIAEFRRVLAPGGILLVSTPNVAGAPDAAIDVNPFHRVELDQAALRALLVDFEVQSVIPQRILGMSLLGDPDPADLEVSRLEGDAGEPRFLVALARVPTDGPEAEPAAAFSPSGLLEPGGRLVADYAGWLRNAEGVAREKDELTALHDDLGHRFLNLQAELEVLRHANARLTQEYDELARTQQDTLTTLATASAALRTLGSS